MEGIFLHLWEFDRISSFALTGLTHGLFPQVSVGENNT